MQFLNEGVFYQVEKIQTYIFLCGKKRLPHKPNNWLVHPQQQQLVQCSGGILAHSCLQKCYNSATLEGKLNQEAVFSPLKT